jgi:hypothetical protein
MVPGDPEFWDIQAIRRCHVLRVMSKSTLQHCDPASGEYSPVDVHVVLHAAGLALIRLTLHLASELLETREISDLDYYNDYVFRGATSPWKVHFDRESTEIDCDIRQIMDAVMFRCHERMMGREEPGALAHLDGTESRYGWLEERVARGELVSPYPVVFGTAYELLWSSEEDRLRSQREVAKLAYGIEPASNNLEFLGPAEVAHDRDWYLSENRSVLSIDDDRASLTALSTYDATRIQVIEYLTLQRSALRAVQRGTQLVITERQTVTRKQLQQWQRLVAATTDEYVLHDRVGAILGPLRNHVRDHPTIRDPAELEAQVRQNLGVFENLINAAGNRVAIILSALIGVVAALSLGSLVRRLDLVTLRTSGDAGDFESLHPVVAIGIDLALLLIVGLIAGAMMRYANRLRGQRQ